MKECDACLFDKKNVSHELRGRLGRINMKIVQCLCALSKMRAKELCPPLFNEARGFVFSFLAKRLPKADVLQQCVLVGGRARGELSSTVRAIF